MKFYNDEKQAIIERASFLVKRGYSIESDDYSIYFIGEEHTIQASVEPYSDEGNLYMVFPGIGRKLYSVAWMAVVNDDIDMRTYHFDQKSWILFLLDYLEKNYEKLTDIIFCQRSYERIHQYIEEKRRTMGLFKPDLTR